VPISAQLGILGLLISSVLGVLAGTLAAIRRTTWIDTLMTFLSNIGMTIPVFWLGVLGIYLFGLELKWLPLQGYVSPFEDFWLSLKHFIMPVICISVIPLASTARQTRSSILEVVRQDYIRTAWSKGLKERQVITGHAMKNGLIPVITLLGIQVPMIFGGNVLVETVFNIPGMGRLLVNSVLTQDYPVVQICVLLLAVMIVFANFLVDLSYSWLDPRVRYS
jgi:peptide/nickel transport system permease protein